MFENHACEQHISKKSVFLGLGCLSATEEIPLDGGSPPAEASRRESKCTANFPAEGNYVINWSIKIMNVDVFTFSHAEVSIGVFFEPARKGVDGGGSVFLSIKVFLFLLHKIKTASFINRLSL